LANTFGVSDHFARFPSVVASLQRWAEIANAFGVKRQMTNAELLTRATIWLTIIAYAIGSAFFALPEKVRWRDHATRLAWTIGCISLIAHLVCAFQFYHGWSHSAAYLDTARQTDSVVGLNWGGGLFINYGLLVAWMADLAWWWLSGLNSYRNRSWPLIAAWHSFLIFIIFNATVVFKDGVVRWLGLGFCILLVFMWIVIARRKQVTVTV
jgi:hypothetical protein